MYGITLIAVLAITGGIIAYIGDKLGTKVGKKKLSIFGLRPKHTSIIVTIITGILISSSTIGVLSLTSRDVRTALFGMKELKAELLSLSTEVSAKSSELSTISSELVQAQIDTQKAKDEAQEYKNQAEMSKNEAQMAKDEAKEYKNQAEIAKNEAQTAKDEAQEYKNQAEIAKNEAQTAKNEAQEYKNQAEFAKNETEIAKMDFDKLSKLTLSLKQGLQEVREGSIVFRAGEVLATTILPKGQVDTQASVTQAIYNANRSILEKLNIDNPNLEVLWISQEDFDKVVTFLNNNPDDVIMRITSSGNVVYGEPVIGHIDLFPNKLIYDQGETIAMSIVDMNGIKAEEAVMLFLKRVNAAAVQKGIIPDPLQGTVGAMSGSEFYDTVSKLKKYSGKVALTATAKADTNAAGPLKIQLYMQGEQTP